MKSLFSKIIIINIFIAAAINGFCQTTITVQSGATLAIQPGTQMTTIGDLILDNGSTLINNGTLRIKNITSGTGDLTDNSSSSHNIGNGRFIFNGTNQSIKSINHFGTIELNNTSLTLQNDITTDDLYLTNGIAYTGSNKIIVTSTAANAIQADTTNAGYANSWINGNLRRYINPSSVNVYAFPVGDTAQSNLAVLDNLNASPLSGVTYIDASFGSKRGTDSGLNASEQGTPYVFINNGGVWYLTPDAQPSSGKYDLDLYFNGFSGLTDNSFGILRRLDSSSNAADWQVPPASSLPAPNAAGRTVSSGYASRKNISGFSQFGIGQTSGALAITLLNFDAKRVDDKNVLLNWTTTSENNNAGFDVERKLENEDQFSKVGFVASEALNGSSAVRLNYFYNDANAYDGMSYYRLKQVDVNGHYSYSAIKLVNGSKLNSIITYPMPANDKINLVAENINPHSYYMLLSNSGRTIAQGSINAGKTTINTAQLPAGSYIIYIANAFGNHKSFAKMIFVVH